MVVKTDSQPFLVEGIRQDAIKRAIHLQFHYVHRRVHDSWETIVKEGVWVVDRVCHVSWVRWKSGCDVYLVLEIHRCYIYCQWKLVRGAMCSWDSDENLIVHTGVRVYFNVVARVFEPYQARSVEVNILKPICPTYSRKTEFSNAAIQTFWLEHREQVLVINSVIALALMPG